MHLHHRLLLRDLVKDSKTIRDDLIPALAKIAEAEVMAFAETAGEGASQLTMALKG